MRKLLLLIVLLYTSPAFATIATDGSTAFDGCGGSCSSFGTGNVNTIHASAVMAVAIDTLSANDTTATVTDGNSSVWSRAATINNGNIRVEIWKCADLLGANVSITVSLSNSREANAVTQFYSGVAAFGTTATNTGTGTTPTIDLITQDNNNFVVAACANDIDTFSANTGNLRGSATSGGGGYAALNDNTSGSPGTVTNTVTAASGDWACTALELRSTTGSAVKKVQTIIVE